jgi:hypothetical protein
LSRFCFPPFFIVSQDRHYLSSHKECTVMRLFNVGSGPPTTEAVSENGTVFFAHRHELLFTTLLKMSRIAVNANGESAGVQPD